MGQIIKIFRGCEMSTTWNDRVGERRRALNLTKTELAKTRAEAEGAIPSKAWVQIDDAEAEGATPSKA